ncbi:MAG: insulinase family protein [Chloroflexi bacterium]|nr:insulinase family protein [Chloroflexota bacterium]
MARSFHLMEDGTYQKTTLANGLRVLTAPMPHTRSVAVSLYVGAGSRYETDEQAGLSHFVEHLCFKGTERRPTSQEISEVIDSVGGVINAATDRELTVYYSKVGRPHFELALDVLADLIRHPLFAADEVEKERQVIIEELAMVADSPAQQVDVLLDETIWPEQPLGRDVAGSEASVNGLSREMAVAYLQRQYVPNNTVVSVAGAVTHEEAVERVSRVLGDWPPGEPGDWFPAVDGQAGPRTSLKYKATEQAHLSLAVRGLSLQHPDRYALSLLSVLLGEGMSSRLVLELRERRGLCYDVHSYVSYFLDTGAFAVYVGVDPARAQEALKVLLEELLRLRDQGVAEEELARAKELAKGRMLLRMEDTRTVSDWRGAQELLTGHIRTVDEVTELIDGVTVEEVRRVARQLLVSDGLNLAVVGPFRSDRRFSSLLRL